MELGKLGNKVSYERTEKLNAKEAERAEILARQQARQEAEKASEAEEERLLKPSQLVKGLLWSRGIEWSEGALPLGGEIRVAERFRLRPTKLTEQSDDESELYLLISGKVSSRDLKPQAMRIALLVSDTDETQPTEHYLTHVSNPTRLWWGNKPENYGFRTYVHGKNHHQVSSHVPDESEAQIIIGLIEEAAEIQGIIDSPAEAAARNT